MKIEKPVKKNTKCKPDKKAWVIAADMGYGHQRTAYPLRDIAFSGKVINANSYSGIPEKDKRIWQKSRSAYEFISRFKSFPYIGDFVFGIMDKFQKILTYYPKRDLSQPTFMLADNLKSIRKDWGKDLIDRLKKN